MSFSSPKSKTISLGLSLLSAGMVEASLLIVATLDKNQAELSSPSRQLNSRRSQRCTRRVGEYDEGTTKWWTEEAGALCRSADVTPPPPSPSLPLRRYFQTAVVDEELKLLFPFFPTHAFSWGRAPCGVETYINPPFIEQSSRSSHWMPVFLTDNYAPYQFSL